MALKYKSNHIISLLKILDSIIVIKPMGIQSFPLASVIHSNPSRCPSPKSLLAVSSCLTSCLRAPTAALPLAYPP